MYDAEDKL